MSLEEFRRITIESIKVVQKVDSVEIADDEDFSDFGLDSLDIMSLQLEIEKMLDINLGEEFDISQYNSIGLLHEYIEKELKS